MSNLQRRERSRFNVRRTYIVVIVSVVLCFSLIGGLSAGLLNPGDVRDSRFREATPPDPPPIPSPTLAKEYIYAGGKLLATEEPAANVAPAVSITSPANNTVVNAPASVTINANATDTDGTVSKVEFFQGSTLLSTDTAAPFSFDWTNVPAGSYSLTARATDNSNAVTTSTAITFISNALPAVSISNPANNAVFTAPASFTVDATASDSDGTISKVEFFQGATLLNTDTSAPFSFNWTNVPSGTYSLTAKATDNRNAVTTSSAISVISNTAPTVSITNPPNNSAFLAPASFTIDAMPFDSDGTVTKVEFFQGATLLHTDTAAPFSFTWTNVPAGSYLLTAKATDNNNATTTSSVVTVNVSTNGAPTVSITSPTNNTVFTAPASITINATANDSDGTISKVEFFQGTTLLNTDTAAPFSFNWTNVPAGTYSLTAKATDNNNAVTTSSAITVISNTLPTVSITSPSNNTVFTAPASITINATASDADGTISKVEFFQGTTLLNTDTSAPFSFNWTNVPSGTYSLTAKATDNNNGVTTSTAISVISNAVPTVSITSPANNAVFQAPASITISANTSDSDGSITKVEFFQGTTLLNTDTAAPFTFNWTNVPAGTYVLTAKSTDNNNAVTTSSAVTVISNAAPAVSITSPAHNSTFTAPANITIDASASDSDGTISKVEFFQGTTLLNTDTAAPFSFNWTNVPAGTYSLTAKATDNNNAVTTSSVVTVTSNSPPAVSITSPANNAIFAPPANITINATATDADGTISAVEFYQGATLIGTDTAAPYTVSLNNVVAGSYLLSARATDNRGAITTSALVAVTTPTFFDDFNDNSLDLGKWTIQTPASPVVVSEQSQQLRITVPGSTASYNGVRSSGTYDMRGGTAQVEQVQSVSQAGWVENTLVLESQSANAYFLINVGAGSIMFRSSLNDVFDQLVIPYDPVGHRFWRIRHNQTTNSVSFETSPNGAVWTSQKTVTPAFSVAAMKFVLRAGAWGTGNATPGAAIYNDFQFIPDPTQGTPPPIFSDDFNDNSLDTTKWDPNNLFSGFTDTSVPLVETGQRLEIGPLFANVSGSHYRGVRSVNTYNFTDSYSFVELVQAPSLATTADAMFTVGKDVDNYYRIYVNAGNLIGQRKIASVKTTLFTIPYEPGNHKFLRIRHTSGNVTLDTAPSNSGVPGTWEQRYSETWNSAVTLTAIIFEVKAGTSVAETNLPGKVIFDNFAYGLNSPPPPSAPTVTGIAPSSGPTTGGTAVTITGTGFLSGATVKLGGTNATNVTVVSSTSITATTPAHSAGVKDVQVTNTDNQSGTLTSGYTYTSTPSETVLLADDFNDNSLDTAKWDVNNLFSGFTDTSLPISETSQRFEIGPLFQNLSGSHYRGLRSVNIYNFTGAYSYTELVQAPSGATAADAMFTVGKDVDNYYRIYVSAGNLIGQKKLGGTKVTLFTIPFDSVNHRFLRIRHNAGSVTLDTAPGSGGTPGTWVQRYSEIWSGMIPLSAIVFEMKGGTSQSETNAPGKVIFDTFRAAVPNP